MVISNRTKIDSLVSKVVVRSSFLAVDPIPQFFVNILPSIAIHIRIIKHPLPDREKRLYEQIG